jgi:hypothetical protein
MNVLDPAYQVLYAELLQRSLDAAFSTDFSVEGRFIRQSAGERNYWYFDTTEDGKKKRRYVGPVDDDEINRRVEQFKDIKADYRARRKLVSTLVREARLPAPLPMVGQLVLALAESGFFRLRGVLVGTVAYQCYAASLGIRLPNAVLQTGDADFAQFHSISVAVGDSTPKMLDVLQGVDPTFRPLPHQNDKSAATQFAARSGYKVEFLTPNVGSDDLNGRPIAMPALGKAAAEPLRFLDYLIYEPVRAVLLHGSGIPVLVPAPERFAIHKLIVASRRHKDDSGVVKSRKDRHQAQILMQALLDTNQSMSLADAYVEAWLRGKAWREAIGDSMKMLDGEVLRSIQTALARSVRELSHDPASMGLPG